MTSEVITLVRGGPQCKLQAEEDHAELVERALVNLESMRQALLSGQIKAFFAVGISKDHTTWSWSGKSSPTTVLELHGAWYAMANDIAEGGQDG
jgi:hypothetical protein